MGSYQPYRRRIYADYGQLSTYEKCENAFNYGRHGAGIDYNTIRNIVILHTDGTYSG
jgi:hypothetical protein